MTGSKIEWTDRSDWNPIRGCTRVSPGCGGPGPHGGCYAERIAARFSDPGQSFHGFAERTKHGGRWTGKVEVQWDRLDLPLRWRAPARIFANSTSDLFHYALPDVEIATIYAVAVAAVHLRGHTIQILTKRSAHMRRLLNAPAFWDQVNAEAGAHVMERTDALERRDNDARATLDEYGPDYPPPGIWLGVSAERQQEADERIPDLLATPAAVRFVSAEPLLGPIDLHPWLLGFAAGHPASCSCGHGHGFDRCPNYGRVAQTCHRCGCDQFRKAAGGDGLHWVIAGGESGPGARPMCPDWARSLRDQCAVAGIRFFMKQVTERGRKLPIEAWPADLRIREMPHG